MEILVGYNNGMIPRTLQARLVDLVGSFPVVYLTGPRQSGKTTLAQACFDDFEYVSLEDLQNRLESIEDPRGFLRRFEGRGGVVLDEVQRSPDLFSYLQGFVDSKKGGPFLLTGSQHFLLSERISQSLAGRAAILELLPFSTAELAGRPALEPADFEDLDAVSEKPPFDLEDILFTGLFPPIHDRGLDAAVWLDGYVRTYVERDLKLLTNVGNLDTFVRFIGLCAGRAGQLLNASALGADAGVSYATARRWISLLRTSYVIDLLQPHHQNFRKRLVKSPKIYFLDTGLLCHLLNIRNRDQLRNHPLRGAVFENFIISELIKLFCHHGQKPPLYFFRDSNGREVDVIIDLGDRRIPVEVKAGMTIAPDFFKSLDMYLSLSKDRQGILVYAGEESYARKNHQVRAWWNCS